MFSNFFRPKADRLSTSRTERLKDYRIQEGDLLQTCSGRNLGPLTIADKYLARFSLSHDMIRISISDLEARYFTLAFLRTPTGQHLLRGDLSGSVIDHITVDHVAALDVPFLRRKSSTIAEMMATATSLRQGARTRLHELIAEYTIVLPQLNVSAPLRVGWSHHAKALNGRLDAGFHVPSVASMRSQLQAIGGVTVREVAETFIPGRYKRYYVEAGHGRPIVSGRQLLQTQPINLSHIAPRSFDPAVYKLAEGMVALGPRDALRNGLRNRR